MPFNGGTTGSSKRASRVQILRPSAAVRCSLCVRLGRPKEVEPLLVNQAIVYGLPQFWAGGEEKVRRASTKGSQNSEPKLNSIPGRLVGQAQSSSATVPQRTATARPEKRRVGAT
jgi:hypothetical protein